MMSALTIFGDGSFIFKFVSYGLMTKPLGIGCTILQGGRESKTFKGQCECFCNQIRIISPSFYGPKCLEATILYNDRQHDILALQSRANQTHWEFLIFFFM